MQVSLCGANFDTFLSVVDMNGNVVAYNDDSDDCAPQSALSFDATALGPLYIIVEGWGAFSGDYTLQITASYVGLDDTEAESFNAYPNPSLGSLRLTPNTGQYQLLNLNGQMLKQLDSESESVFELNYLESGVYLLKKQTTGQVQKWQKL